MAMVQEILLLQHPHTSTLPAVYRPPERNGTALPATALPYVQHHTQQCVQVTSRVLQLPVKVGPWCRQLRVHMSKNIMPRIGR